MERAPLRNPIIGTERGGGYSWEQAANVASFLMGRRTSRTRLVGKELVRWKENKHSVLGSEHCELDRLYNNFTATLDIWAGVNAGLSPRQIKASCGSGAFPKIVNKPVVPKNSPGVQSGPNILHFWEAVKRRCAELQVLFVRVSGVGSVVARKQISHTIGWLSNAAVPLGSILCDKRLHATNIGVMAHRFRHGLQEWPESILPDLDLHIEEERKAAVRNSKLIWKNGVISACANGGSAAHRFLKREVPETLQQPITLVEGFKAMEAQRPMVS